MKIYNKGEIDLAEFPKDIAMPFGVSSGIKARRCIKCGRIRFTNKKVLKECKACTRYTNA